MPACPEHLGRGGIGWAALSGLFAAVGLIGSFVALQHADAVVAVPVMSTYPVVTVLASVAILSEAISGPRIVGILLILAGVIVLAR